MSVPERQAVGMAWVVSLGPPGMVPPVERVVLIQVVVQIVVSVGQKGLSETIV